MPQPKFPFAVGPDRRQSRPRRVVAGALVLLLVSAAAGGANDLDGLVRGEEGLPLPGATVVVAELDLVTTTDAYGRFSIPDPPAGSLEILVVLEGYEDNRATIQVPVTEPLVVALRRLLVDMGEITVEAEPDEAGAPAVEYTRKQIEGIPTAGDPLGVIALTPGVQGAGALSMGYGSYEAGSVPQAALAVRGTNPFGNTFLFEYIRAPTLLHLRGLPSPRSAVPSALTESVQVLRGGFGVEYGPGYGGIFVFHPTNEIPERAVVTLRTSLLNLDASAEIPISACVGLQLSARKSLYELTWEPLLWVIQGSEYPKGNVTPRRVLTGEGDYLARLVAIPSDRHLITVDCLGLIDYRTSRPVYPIPEDRLPDDHVIVSTDLYSYHAQGLRWTAQWGELAANTVYAYDSLLSRPQDEDTAHVSGDESSTREYVDSVTRFAGGDSFRYEGASGVGVRMGLEGSYLLMRTARDWATWENGSLTEEYHSVYSGECVETSAYGELRYAAAIAEVGLGVRGDYFGLFEQIVPSVRGFASFRPAEGLELSLSGGMYPGTANYLEYLSARHNAASNPTYPVQDRVSSSLYGDLRASYEPREAVTLAAEGYVNWMRDLSGFDPQYSELLPEEHAWEGADQGLAWGAELTGAWAASEKLSLTGSYEYQWVRYRTVDARWRAASFEVPHTLRGTISWRPTPPLLLAANLRVSAGYPFTPYVVNGYVEGEGYTIEYGEASSMRDWVPGFALDVRLAVDVHLFGSDQVLFMDVANLLAGPARGTPENDDLLHVGMDTRKVSDRTYRFPDWTNTVLDFGMEARVGR